MDYIIIKEKSSAGWLTFYFVHKRFQVKTVSDSVINAVSDFIFHLPAEKSGNVRVIKSNSDQLMFGTLGIPVIDNHAFMATIHELPEEELLAAQLKQDFSDSRYWLNIKDEFIWYGLIPYVHQNRMKELLNAMYDAQQENSDEQNQTNL